MILSFTLPHDNPDGDSSQVADSNLRSFKHRVKILVTFLYPYSALAKQDAIVEIHFPIPSPSPLGSQAFILDPHDPEGHMQEKKPSVSDFLHQPCGAFGS